MQWGYLQGAVGVTPRRLCALGGHPQGGWPKGDLHRFALRLAQRQDVLEEG